MKRELVLLALDQHAVARVLQLEPRLAAWSAQIAKRTRFEDLEHYPGLRAAGFDARFAAIGADQCGYTQERVIGAQLTADGQPMHPPALHDDGCWSGARLRRAFRSPARRRAGGAHHSFHEHERAFAAARRGVAEKRCETRARIAGHHRLLKGSLRAHSRLCAQENLARARIGGSVALIGVRVGDTCAVAGKVKEDDVAIQGTST